MTAPPTPTPGFLISETTAQVLKATQAEWQIVGDSV